MKTLQHFIVLLAVLLTTQMTQAQGTTYLSNLGQPSTGSLAVGSDSWVAALFRTGNNTGGYDLNSINLGMADASGSPNGFAVSIYSMNFVAAIPGNNLGALHGSLNPVQSGIFTYTPASNLTLSPNSYYYIVLTAVTATVTGAYDLNLAGANSYNPSGGWTSFGGNVQTSSDGTSWSLPVSVNPQYAITATPIPEPSSEMLLGLGGLLLLGIARRKAKVVQ